MRWLTIYLDDPVEVSGRARALWCAVTGTTLSPARGEHDEYATLLPATGDAHLRVQATRGTTSGVHLDLHVDDVEAAAADAVTAGAEVVARPDHVVLRSPGGFDLCLVEHHGEHRAAPPVIWPDGHRSRLDQLTVDVAHDRWEAELRFWSELTGWEVTRATTRPELARLATPARLPVRVLLQQRRTGATQGHVDLATDDRRAEVDRLETLGLRRLAHGPTWTVMQVSHGPVLCVTDRDPVTGLLR